MKCTVCHERIHPLFLLQHYAPYDEQLFHPAWMRFFNRQGWCGPVYRDDEDDNAKNGKIEE